MDRNRHSKSKHKSHNWNDQRRNYGENNSSSRNFYSYSDSKSSFHNYSNNSQKKAHYVTYETSESQAQKEKAIKDFKEREVLCSKCGKPITDMASSMASKNGSAPMHFECAMEQVSCNEKLEQNEKIAYIGQGRFAVLSYENIRDQRHFKIKKIIEWESRDAKPEWRSEISNLFSQVE